MNHQRIWAVIGLILIVGSIVCMVAGMFLPAAKDLLMQVSFVGFIGAAGVLAALSILRKKAQEKDDQAEQ